jgi:hypothetical protein
MPTRSDDETRKEVPPVSEAPDAVHATLLAATLSHLMLDVAKQLFPHRPYFDLTAPEKETVADHVRRLLLEVQATFAGPALEAPPGGITLPPQRDEEYL